MRYFKCPDLKDPYFLEARKILGEKGCFQIIEILQESYNQKIYKIDCEIISGWLRIKRDRAEKILPFAQKILRKCSKIWQKSSEISENLSDFDTSNPHGSTRDLVYSDSDSNEEREEESCARENSPQPPDEKSDEKPEENRGVIWFKITRPGLYYPGGSYTEKEWLLTETVRYLRSRKHNIRGDTDFDTLCIQNTYANGIFNDWIRYPIAKRLAAYVYAVIERKVVDQADYARKALMQSWEGAEKHIRKAEEILKKGLEVEFNE